MMKEQLDILVLYAISNLIPLFITVKGKYIFHHVQITIQTTSLVKQSAAAASQELSAQCGLTEAILLQICCSCLF